MRARTKVLITAAVAVPLVLAGAGTAYATHFQDRALPGSTLGGVSVSGLTRDQVAAIVTQRAADLTVTLDTGTSTRTAHLADLGYTVDVEPTVDAVFAANGSWSSYATSLVSSRDVEAVLRVDPATTDKVAAELVTTSGKAGADAKVKLAPNKKSFVVVAAVTGKSVTPSSFQDVVSAAARDLSSTRTTLKFVDAVPTVTTAQAQRVADRANALVARTVKVDDGEDEHAASRKTKASWVTVTGADGALTDPTIDAAKVKAWVAKVAKDAEVTATSGVRNVDASGDVKQVVTPAHDGAVMTNAADVAAGRDQGAELGQELPGQLRAPHHPGHLDRASDRRRCREPRLRRHRRREVGRRQPRQAHDDRLRRREARLRPDQDGQRVGREAHRGRHLPRLPQARAADDARQQRGRHQVRDP